jgi:hypothetical protein
MRFRPSTVFNCVSRGRTIKRSASSGEMPGWNVKMLKKGMGISGSASLGIEK